MIGFYYIDTKCKSNNLIKKIYIFSLIHGGVE